MHLYYNLKLDNQSETSIFFNIYLDFNRIIVGMYETCFGTWIIFMCVDDTIDLE